MRVIQPATRELCAPGVAEWWDTHGHQYANEPHKSGGAIACSADPTRPVILLFHGVHQNKTTWTAPSYVEYAYDYSRAPSDRRIGDTHSEPRVGLYDVGKSDWLYGSEDNRAQWDSEVNWFDYLRRQNFTVATWSQNLQTIAQALPSALAAFDSIVGQTARRSPSSLPPIAILAHSRGGLVARRVLKEKGGMSRVRWVITIHSPHSGSQLGKYPNELGAEIIDLIDGWGAWPDVPAGLDIPDVKQQAKDAAAQSLEPLTRFIMGPEEVELYPGSPFLTDLANGETSVPDAKYYTFGGTNPRVYRMYAWLYDPMSAVVQCCRGTSTYYVWRVKPVELPISPILDAVRDFVPEVKPGYGDSLVAEENTKLPWSLQHFITTLNHAEVLWNRDLQRQVVDLIK